MPTCSANNMLNIACHIERVNNKEIEVYKILMHPKKARREECGENMLTKGTFRSMCWCLKVEMEWLSQKGDQKIVH